MGAWSSRVVPNWPCTWKSMVTTGSVRSTKKRLLNVILEVFMKPEMKQETKTDAQILEGVGDYKFGFSDPENYVFKSGRGLSREIVEQISAMKGEPEWML